MQTLVILLFVAVSWGLPGDQNNQAEYDKVNIIDYETKGLIPTKETMQACTSCYWPSMRNFNNFHKIYAKRQIKKLTEYCEDTRKLYKKENNLKVKMDLETYFDWQISEVISTQWACYRGYICEIELTWSNDQKRWHNSTERRQTIEKNKEFNKWLIMKDSKYNIVIKHIFQGPYRREIWFKNVTWFQAGAIKIHTAEYDFKININHSFPLTLDSTHHFNIRYSIPDGIFGVKNVPLDNYAYVNSNK